MQKQPTFFMRFYEKGAADRASEMIEFARVRGHTFSSSLANKVKLSVNLFVPDGESAEVTLSFDSEADRQKFINDPLTRAKYQELATRVDLEDDDVVVRQPGDAAFLV